MTTFDPDIEIQADAKRPRGPSRARLLIAPWLRLPSLADLREEISAQTDRWTLWTPVALGCGCGLYFALPREPALWFAGLLTAAAASLALAARRRLARPALVIATTLLAFAAGGLLVAKVRTERVAAPIAPVTKMVHVEGWVVDVASPGASGGRLIIAPTAIEGLPPEALPLRIRVTVRDDRLVAPGRAASFRGLINPPPPPAAPGAYDFARNAWFDGIGGVGVVLTDLREIDLPPPPLRLKLQLAVNAMRWRLAERIAGKMSETSRGLGVAMITGHEAWIDPDQEDRLRDAGLAHIISISGLHMAIVAGSTFFLVRLLIALIPPLALRVPGKKVAAVFGLAAIAGYLVVSGMPPPAQRAAITGSVMLAAVLVDRRAFSMHALAIAALLVLLFQPEAVVEPGFQMSFAATAALVALAEAWPARVREINTPWPIRLVQGGLFWLGVSLLASLVAGAATGPFAIQHFNRVAVYGLPANLFSEPISTFVIMPALAIGAVLEAVGIGGPALSVAGWGIERLVGTADVVTQAPHATLLVASAPPLALPVAFLGILWICLWKGRLRWLGLPAAFAVSLWPRPDPPAAWIAADGAAVALREGKAAVLMRTSDKRFGAELWANRRGLRLPGDLAAARDRHFACAAYSCIALGGQAPRISAWWTVRKPKAEVLDRLCAASDILVIKAAVELPAACNGVTILRPADFARGGAVEVFPSPGGWRLSWAQPLRGQRPWTSPGGTEF